MITGCDTARILERAREWVLVARPRPVRGRGRGGRGGQGGRGGGVAALPWPPQHPVPPDPQRIGREAEIDDDWLADNVRARQETPEPAVVGLVAVVAHHEEMAR